MSESKQPQLMTKQQHNSIIIREATIEDILQYKRGKKEVNPKDYYLCQCDCGNFWCPSKKNYNKGKSTSCGRHSNDGRIIDETGHRYGELVVIGPAPKRHRSEKDHRQFWYCRCSCGNITSVSGKDLRQQKVLSCGHVKSKGEQLITQILTNNLIQFQTQYTFTDFRTELGSPYRFDWAIFKNNQLFCLLEYDGEQHFDKNNPWYRKDTDNIKNEYCKSHNIPLYRISYKEFNQLNFDYINNLISYKEN